MSNKEKIIDDFLDNLVKSGSEISYLKELREKSLSIIKKDIDLKEVLNNIAEELKVQTKKFLNQKNKDGVNYISGLSTCIYLPDMSDNGEYKLKLIGGNRSRDIDLKVDENTMFDIASITKLYTLLLLFKLEEEGLIDLNTKISDINPDFKNLEDFTLNDLVRLHGEPRTIGRVDSAKTKEEAYEILKTLYLYSNTRKENKYTDLGAIVIGDTIEKIISKKMGMDISFQQIMNEYLFKPLNLTKTVFNPKGNNLSGNGNNLGLVHDPKARLLGGAVGSAGIFTTSDDLARLSREIYSVSYINKDHIVRLGEITFPNAFKNNQGNLGIYVKHPLGYLKTFTPPEFSLGSFSHQGTTGSIATFDPNNLIHNNILVNAIYNTNNKDLIKNNKLLGFMSAFSSYQVGIMQNIMLMFVVKYYYNKYCNIKENINEVKIL